MILTKPLALSDIENWLPRHEGDLLCLPSVQAQMSQRVKGFSSVKFVLADDPAISVAATGILQSDLGIGEAWLLTAPGFEKYWQEIVRKIRVLLNMSIEVHDYRRIQAVVRSDFVAAQRFIRIMSFVREGTLKRFGPDGSDYDIYRYEGKK